MISGKYRFKTSVLSDWQSALSAPEMTFVGRKTAEGNIYVCTYLYQVSYTASTKTCAKLCFTVFS